MGSSACLSSFNFFCLFVLVFPLPSLLFSAAMQEVINGLQCLPQLVHFLHFLFVFPLPSPKFYTQALDQAENKPGPRAKAKGQKDQGKRAKAKGQKGQCERGQEPGQKSQGQKGKRAKGQGAKEPRAKGQKSQGQRTQGQPRLLEKLHFAKKLPKNLSFVCIFCVASAKLVI